MSATVFSGFNSCSCCRNTACGTELCCCSWLRSSPKIVCVMVFIPATFHSRNVKTGQCLTLQKGCTKKNPKQCKSYPLFFVRGAAQNRMRTFVLQLVTSEMTFLKLFLVCRHSFTVLSLLCWLGDGCSKCSFAKVPLSFKSHSRICKPYKLISQRNYFWLSFSISTTSAYTIYSSGSCATPTLSAFANSSLKLAVIAS